MNDGIWTVIGVALFLMVVVSWLTHLVVCFTQEAWGFLIAGAIFFPIGVVHGAGSMFGFW